MLSRHSPAPASKVSATCISTESPASRSCSDKTEAIPPCAHAVLDSKTSPFANTTTDP